MDLPPNATARVGPVTRHVPTCKSGRSSMGGLVGRERETLSQTEGKGNVLLAA